MNQNPNNNPYRSNPNYPPTPGLAYGGRPSTGPNPHNYGQPPAGPNPYNPYAQPPVGPGDPTPNSVYGSPAYAPPPPGSDAMAGPYDLTIPSQANGAAYLPYPSPSNSDFGTPPGMPHTLPPAKKGNARIVLLSVIALLVIVGGILSIMIYNNHATAQSMANATANAQATAASIKTHYPFSSKQVFNDHLLGNSNAAKYGWDQGQDQYGGCNFANGAYEVTNNQAGSSLYACAAKNTNFANFTYEIQMTLKSGDTEAKGGVVFRADMANDRFYNFLLTADGAYTLEARGSSSGSGGRNLEGGTIAGFTTGFNRVHTIGIVANGSQISVYVDQNKVTQTSDSTYTGGAIGVITYTNGSTPTVVDYNNAKVWQL